jgi:hypothetical protein
MKPAVWPFGSKQSLCHDTDARPRAASPARTRSARRASLRLPLLGIAVPRKRTPASRRTYTAVAALLAIASLSGSAIAAADSSSTAAPATTQVTTNAPSEHSEPSQGADTTEVALIAAGASILGGLLGAVGGGLSDYFLERHRNKTKATAGARLIRSELLTAAEQIWSAEESGKWKIWFDFSMKNWDAYGDSLAGALDSDLWAIVDQAVRGVRGLATGVAKLDEYGTPIAPELPLGAASISAFAVHRKRVASAYDALATLANGAKASGEFGKGQQPTS